MSEQIDWAALEEQAQDGDLFQVMVENDVVPATVVEFRLEAGPSMREWKGINVPDGEGNSWEIWTQGDRKTDSVSLGAQQVANGQALELRRERANGVRKESYSLDGIERISGGTRVTFRWLQDGSLDSREAMEFVAPPQAVPTPDGPNPAPEVRRIPRLRHLLRRSLPTLSFVPACYMGSCEGGDQYANNCAHYLSDAFIRAGYTELQVSSMARCSTSAHRPIRAREMRSWFASKARVTLSVLPQQGSGTWAVFQLDESAYWGGHVVVLDANTWQYFGTGWYGNWAQECYQW
jgi:hypothetical protein